MSAPQNVGLKLVGWSPALLKGLSKELRQAGITTNDSPDNPYKVVTVDLSSSDVDQQQLLSLLHPDNPSQKIAIVLVVHSLDKKTLLESYLTLIHLKLNDLHLNSRLVIVYDLYYSNNAEIISGFENWLQNITLHKKVVLSQDGRFPLYPTSLQDLTRALLKSLFSQQTKGKTFQISGENYTDLELGYLLKDKLSELNINLDIDTTSLKAVIPITKDDFIHTQAELNWLPQDSFSKEIKNIINKVLNVSDNPPSFSIQSILPEPEVVNSSSEISLQNPPPKKLKALNKTNPFKTKNLEESDFTVKAVEKRGFQSILKFLILFFFVSLITPYLILVSSTFLATQALTSSYQSFRQSSLKSARTQLQFSDTATNWADFWFQRTLPVTNTLVSSQAKDLNNYLLLLRHSQSLLTTVYDTYALFDRYYQGLIGRGEPVNPEVLSGLRLNLDQLLESLSQIQLLLQEARLPLGINPKLINEDFSSRIQTLKKQIQTSLGLIEVLEKLTTQGLVKILVVVQDDTELRATGGFLNTALLLTLNQNRLVNWQVEPSLAIDRLIEGRVDPPPVLIKALGQNQWFFRDSNFEANYPETASQIAWFWERFKNEKVDAVLALNSTFYKDLLAEIGALDLSNGQSVTKDNLRLLLSTPSTDPNSDLLTNLTQSFMQKWLAGHIGFIPLARASINSVSNGELALWLSNQDLKPLVSTMLNGEVKPSFCHPQLNQATCQSDLIYLNESNLSVSKVNAYLKREQQHAITIDAQGSANFTLNYLYTYPVSAPTNLNQEYQAYYQLFLPKGVHDLQISLDDLPLNPENLAIKSQELLDKYEFYLPHSLNNNHRLTVQFSLAQRLDPNSVQTAYQTTFLKQAGTSDLFQIKVNYPIHLLPKVLTAPLKSVASGQLEYSATHQNTLSLGYLFQNLNR